MYNILNVIEISEEEKKKIEAAAPGADFVYTGGEKPTRAQLEAADIILGGIDIEECHDLPRLKLLQLDWAGSDNFAKTPLFQAENAPILSNATGAYGGTIAEWMIGSIIMLIRHFQVYRDKMHEHKWERDALPSCIYGKKTLVLGFGDIGENFAVRMKAMGSEVTAIRRTVQDKPDYVKAVYTMDKLDELLPEMDIVALCLPNSPSTTRVINKERIEKMKDGAVLINAGRGPAVDLMAVAEALNSGKLSAAAVDVTDPEPLPEDHPLWDCKNALITPHVAGLSMQPFAHERIIERFVNNISNFISGNELECVVDLKTGYRKI